LNVRAHRPLLDDQLRIFLKQIADSSPELDSIWLIGSRANGTATESSDWDFIAFGTSSTLETLRSDTRLHREKTDFLVVTNGEDFEAAWGEIDKTGSLSEWEWKVLSASESEYTQSKWVEREEGSRVECTRSRGIKVWPG
jgi:predicted nucleotidyltransferase